MALSRDRWKLLTIPRLHLACFLASLLLLVNVCGGDAGSAATEDGPLSDGASAAVPSGSRAVLLDPTNSAWSESAPDTFLATVETTAGEFVIQVVRAWAPIGADRFFNLARHGYYDDARFHRVVPGFITQWGVAGDPEVTAVWYDRGMPDDRGAASNVRGTVAFAFTDPGTRSTQVYINMVDNSRLDTQGFAPFGSVIEGLESVVDSIYSGYGEESGGGVRAGNQTGLVEGGNAYLDAEFPELDHIIGVQVSRGAVRQE